eukprot:COSAG06_NODE_449_length_15623_cov_50.097204_3_plen_171_part_00
MLALQLVADADCSSAVCGVVWCGVCVDSCGAACSVRKTASFFEFSLCLSRTCLGKMIVFIYKWRKNTVFRRATSVSDDDTSEASVSVAGRRTGLTSEDEEEEEKLVLENLLCADRPVRCAFSQAFRSHPHRHAAHSLARSHHALFFEFSLCLSRACLGKMFVFICKWRKK